MKYLTPLILILLVACSTPAEQPTTDVAETAPEPTAEAKEATKETPKSAWLDTTLTDVNTNTEFKISQFEKPVLVESFAVWCPKCTKQQKVIKELHEEQDDFVSIALNTDPQEDAALVKEHAQSNGFDWRYAVAPKEMVQQLVDQFGLGVVSAPSVPMILLCPEKPAKLLERGNKNKEVLKEAIASC